jgi:RNA 3'-terminal phosphate cyclase
MVWGERCYLSPWTQWCDRHYNLPLIPERIYNTMIQNDVAMKLMRPEIFFMCGSVAVRVSPHFSQRCYRDVNGCWKYIKLEQLINALEVHHVLGVWSGSEWSSTLWALYCQFVMMLDILVNVGLEPTTLGLRVVTTVTYCCLWVMGKQSV